MRNSMVLPLLACLGCLLAPLLHAQQDVRLNDDETARMQESPSIAADSSGALIVTWNDRRNGPSQIYHTRSTDGGLTWSPTARVSSPEARPTGGLEMGPNVATGPGGAVYLNWADMRRSPLGTRIDICVARSTDGGATFSGDPRINNDSISEQHQPSITTGSDGTVYAAWHGFPSSGHSAATPVFIARSTTMGSTFEPQRRVDFYDQAADPAKTGSCNCCRPWVFTDGSSNVYVAYRIDSASIRDIFLARSTDRGQTWLPAVRASKGMWKLHACPSVGPAGVARNDTLFVTWMDGRSSEPGPSVYIARSVDGGATFGPDILLDRSANFASVAIDARGRVFALWSGQAPGGNIYCSVSEDGGITFGPRKRVNWESPKTRNSTPACVAAPDGNIYGVWMDTRRDDGDIFFSNLTQLMIVASAESDRTERRMALELHPNPVSGGDALEIELTGSPRSLLLVDRLGRIVERLDHTLPWQRVTPTESGVYFVVADFGEIRLTRPFTTVR